MAEAYRYKAFISYRHAPLDRKWARWLLQRLETFRTPTALARQGIAPRVGRLYRDDDEVPASSQLSNQIEEALSASEFLVVVCSPSTPSSKWVRREIEFFQRIGRGAKILALLVEGEPAESFPPELLHVFRERIAIDGTIRTELVGEEPIAGDVRLRPDESRNATERRAFLRIASGLLGCSFNSLAQREARRRSVWNRVRAGLSAVFVALLAAGGTAAFYEQRFSREQGINDIRSRAYILAGSVTAPLAFADDAAAQSYVDAFATDPQINAVGVYDANGRLIVKFGKAESKLPLRRSSAGQIEFRGIDVLVMVPAKDRDQILGYVVVDRRTESKAVRFARESETILLSALAGAALLGIALWHYLSNSVRPLFGWPS